MFVRFILLMCVVLLTTGCSRSSYEQLHPVTKSPAPQRVQKTIPLPASARIYIQGNMNITLHTGYSHPRIVLSGDARDLSKIATKVNNGSVRLTLRKIYPQYLTINVDVYSHYLNAFEYHGTGTIIGKHLHSSLLDLVIENQGSTVLGGSLGVRKLELAGNGTTEISGINSPSLAVKLSGKQKIRTSGFVNLTTLDLDNDTALSLYWVKSRALTIRGRGQSIIQLAGAVEHLEVELWGTAQFRGRYLRAERSFVKTHDKSVAEISAVKRQHTLAKDASDIQFFNIPVMKADFMAFNGAVLDMRDLGPPFIQEYNQYNK